MKKSFFKDYWSQIWKLKLKMLKIKKIKFKMN